MKNLFKQNKYITYRNELADLLVSCFTPTIKLNCGLCGCKPNNNAEVLYVNNAGVCKDCSDKEIINIGDENSELIGGEEQW